MVKKVVLLLIIAVACDKTPSDSLDDSTDEQLLGVWLTKLVFGNPPNTFEGLWEFSSASISIDWYGLGLYYSPTYSIDPTADPKQIDLDFDVNTPFHYDPVPGIYEIIGQDSLVIRFSNMSDGNQMPVRPTNFNISEDNDNFVFEFTRVE